MPTSTILRLPFPSNSSGKELADSGDAAAASDEEIPTIDFSALTSGDPEERAQIVRKLGCACKDWGFFIVVNHGVPAELRSAMMEACEGFFDLKEEEKEEYTGRGVMEAIRCGTSFNSAVEEDVRYWRDFFKVFVHPTFHSPMKPASFRYVLLSKHLPESLDFILASKHTNCFACECWAWDEILAQVSEDYTRHTRRLAKAVLNAIWESLGLEENYMDEVLGLGSCFQVLVGNLYRPCPQAEFAWGLPAHSDHGLLTVLMQNGIDGLQVMHDAKWVHVKPCPNSFLINLGDHMEIVSNGKYKSVLHRAKVNNKSTRISVVTLIGPSMETVVVPAPILVEREKQPAAFRGLKYREFVEHQQSNQLKEKSVLDLLRL